MIREVTIDVKPICPTLLNYMNKKAYHAGIERPLVNLNVLIAARTPSPFAT